MRIFVDIDGTITDRQRANSAFKDLPRLDVIAKVRKLAAEGHEIILWSGSTEYAQRVAAHFGLPVIAAIGKPHMIVDNEKEKWGKRLQKRTILPEEFLAQDIKD